MLVKTFENNGKNISENIVKLNLKQNTNLCCITIWSTYKQRKQIFDNFMISLPDKTQNSLWQSSQLRVIIESACDCNLYLVTTRLIHKLKTTGLLQGLLSLSSFRDWSNEYQELLLKSKLSPHSGLVSPWGSWTPSTKRDHKVTYILIYIYY